MSEKQDSNLRCSQLKLDWKTCQGTAEQPRLPAVAGETFPWPVLSTVDPRTAPHNFPKQTHGVLSIFSARLHQGLGLQNSVLGGSADHRAAEVQVGFWARWSQTTSASCLLRCSALGEKALKNQFTLRQGYANLLKCLTVNVFGNKPVDVSSFLYPL